MKPWSFIFNEFDPEKEPLRETLTTLGNGYFATRGAAEETDANDIHYPGTYLAGGYNRLTSTVKGRKIQNEDLVNFPNWLPLTFRIETGAWFNINFFKLLKFSQELNIKTGTLVRILRLEDSKGRKTKLVTRRLVSMAQPHIAAIQWQITPENYSGKLTLKSGLDGNVLNSGVKRYSQLKNKHLDILKTVSLDKDSVALLVQTNQSKILMAQACRTRVFSSKKQLGLPARTQRDKGWIGKSLTFRALQGKTYTVEKIVSLYTSGDPGITDPANHAKLLLNKVGRYSVLLKSHTQIWKNLWKKFDIVFEGHPCEEIILRLHIFHLLQTVSHHSAALDVGVPARGLHGEAYRGHIFWDELFIFPLYNYRSPQITRHLLRYRYNRLDMARFLAKKNGYRGAMFPWQSGSDGREETQQYHLNPRSGRWLKDSSHLQRHVNLAIAYNIWQYYSVSRDLTFLENYGAEIYFEIARFLSSLTHFNKKRRKYEIRGVMGPDEYHEAYPNRRIPGLNNNAYTNVMTAWVLKRSFKILAVLSETNRKQLTQKLSLSPRELEIWRKTSKNLFIPFHHDSIISQFEGYEKLKEFDWDLYKKKYGKIERLDRILEAEGDTPNRYKVSKQADVCMLFYLLPYRVLKEIFNDLGYTISKPMIRKNIHYYLQRTSHGSTLSKVVHASILERYNRKKGWNLFNAALQSDVADVQGGTTPEGIHLGAMAGTAAIVLRDFTGLDIRGEAIAFNPQLPSTLKQLHFRLKFRQNWLKLNFNHESFTIHVERGGKVPVLVEVKREKHYIQPGSRKIFPL